jgi:hypothetical protein
LQISVLCGYTLELSREMADGNPATEAYIAADLVKSIAESFSLKD